MAGGGEQGSGTDWIGDYARPVRAIKAGIWLKPPAERSKKGQVRQGGDWRGRDWNGWARSGLDWNGLAITRGPFVR